MVGRKLERSESEGGRVEFGELERIARKGSQLLQSMCFILTWQVKMTLKKKQFFVKTSRFNRSDLRPRPKA